MPHTWVTKDLNSQTDVIDTLDELQGKRWYFRGHSQPHGVLVPGIDRKPRNGLGRPHKLRLESEAIALFRSSVRHFASPGESGSLSDPFLTLAVMQHYGVPTRLLDWSSSAFVATWFAVAGDDSADGELWAFDEPAYEVAGKAQWRRHPETTTDNSGDDSKFDAKLTAFTVAEPPDWVVAMMYPAGFPRQNAQFGAYTMTARFGVDHADAICKLFGSVNDGTRYHRYTISAALKPSLRAFLRDRYGIARGSLFPDSAGAAETVRLELFSPRCRTHA